MLRRLRKIYPLHLLCLLFFLVVSRSDFDLAVLLNALLLQSWVPDPNYYFSCNSVSWFLSSLLFCYLVFPLACRRMSVWLTLVVFSACSLAYLVVPAEKVNAILYVHPLVRFVDFYIGMLLCRWFERGYRVPQAGWLECLLIVCLVTALAVYPWMDVKFRNAPLYWLVLIPLVFVFAKGEGRVSAWLSTRPMQLLASLSMPFYMIHQMLTGILIRRLPKMPEVLMLFVCLLTILSVSWLIDRFFLHKMEKVV
jgi:peptidoglycan/LPS O-acetylase OafA/YrhL